LLAADAAVVDFQWDSRFYQFHCEIQFHVSLHELLTATATAMDTVAMDDPFLFDFPIPFTHFP